MSKLAVVMLVGLACGVASAGASGCVESTPDLAAGAEAPRVPDLSGMNGAPDASSDTLDSTPPGLDGPPPPPLPPCGDALVSGATEQNLPEPVARTRRLLLRAALDGDWDALDSLSRGHLDFKFSFADPGGRATEYWITYQGASFLRDLALTLASEPSEEGGTYAWPAVAARDWGNATDAERAVMACLTSRDALSEMDREDRYLGPRTAIAPDGTWGYFLSGD